MRHSCSMDDEREVLTAHEAGNEERARARQMKNTGAPSATKARPIDEIPGCVTIVLSTSSAAAMTNNNGVAGYPGTRNGRTALGSARRSAITASAPPA